MGSKIGTHCAAGRTMPRDARADEILEFLFNDEMEAPCGEHSILGNQLYTPALQEYLEDLYEYDARPGAARAH